MDQEAAKLWLYGANLSTTQSAIGIKTSDNRSFTFFVDLRRVLGETLFAKYDMFKVYIGNENSFISGAAGLSGVFVNGLNIIQASYQGNKQGYNTAIGYYNQNVTSTESLITNLGGQIKNTREFVMIKPDNTNIEINFTFPPDNGTAVNLNPSVFFLTFVPVKKDKIYKNPFNYLYQNELANFTLTTQILSAGATNQYGTMNSTFTAFTFTNVNMRRIIGTLWDKFDKFNLICQTVGIAQTSTVLSGAQRFLWFQMEGLQFINCIGTTTTSSYSQGIGYTPVFRYATASTSEGDCMDNPSSMLSFRKPESENVDLAFQMFTANLGGQALNLAMSGFSLTFAVVGIKE